MAKHKGKGMQKARPERQLVTELVDELRLKGNKKMTKRDIQEDVKDEKNVEKPERFRISYNTIIVGKND